MYNPILLRLFNTSPFCQPPLRYSKRPHKILTSSKTPSSPSGASPSFSILGNFVLSWPIGASVLCPARIVKLIVWSPYISYESRYSENCVLPHLQRRQSQKPEFGCLPCHTRRRGQIWPFRTRTHQEWATSMPAWDNEIVLHTGR